MPCGDSRDYLQDESLRASQATRAACDLLTVLRRGGTEADLSGETRIWVRQHDIEDAARLKEEERRGIRETLRRQALQKLTQDERRALGH